MGGAGGGEVLSEWWCWAAAAANKYGAGNPCKWPWAIDACGNREVSMSTKEPGKIDDKHV